MMQDETDMCADERLSSLVEYFLDGFNCNSDNAEDAARDLLAMIRDYRADPNAYLMPENWQEWKNTLDEWKWKQQRK